MNSENDLLIKVAEGNENSFKQLFLMCHPQLGTHVFRITKTVNLAEEIVPSARSFKFGK